MCVFVLERERESESVCLCLCVCAYVDWYIAYSPKQNVIQSKQVAIWILYRIIVTFFIGALKLSWLPWEKTYTNLFFSCTEPKCNLYSIKKGWGDYLNLHFYKKILSPFYIKNLPLPLLLLLLLLLLHYDHIINGQNSIQCSSRLFLPCSISLNIAAK